MTELSAITEARFSATAVEADGEIVVHLGGNADVTVKDRLEGFLDIVHAEARRRGVSRVKVDVRQLSFMSSSCFKDFIWWLEKVREMGDAERYRISFQSSASQHWQRRSLHALTRFAHDLITVEAS